jgi:WD40 repeat protein
MDDKPDLAALLDQHMKAAGFKAPRLADTVNEVFQQPDFINRSTITNWLTGISKTVRDWRQVAAIASVLHLDEVKANQLLDAAGHPAIHRLWSQSKQEDRIFLEYWMDPTALEGIHAELKEIRVGGDVREQKLDQIQVGIALIHDYLKQNAESVPSPPFANYSIQSWQHKTKGGITSVAASADGEKVVAATLAKTVLGLNKYGQIRWEAPVGNQAWRVGMSANGNQIVVGTGSTRFWDMSERGLYCFTENGLLHWHKDLRASIWGLSFSIDGSTIAAGTSTKKVLVLDDQGNELWQHEVPGIGWYAWVWATALSADGRIVAAGAADSRVRLFNRTGQLFAEYQTRGDVFTVSVSVDGRVAAAADKKGYVYLLDNQGYLLWENLLDEYIWQIKLSDDGNYLLIGAGRKKHHIYFYNRGGGLVWQRFVGGNASCLDLSAGGQLVAVGTYEGGIHIFDGVGNVLHKAQARKKIRDIAISANGTIVLAGSEDKTVYGFNLTINNNHEK